MELKAQWDPPRFLQPHDLGVHLEELDPAQILDALLGGLNLCSKELKWRQYDHEVKGLSVVKPLIGVEGDVPSDATVMRVEHGRPEVILLAEGIAPRLSDLDTRTMVSWVVDLAARRIVAAGGLLGQIAGLDNFCWPDPVESAYTPDGKQKLAALVRACEALAEMTRGLELPCISGKDSMKNDSTRGGVKISIPPTLLFSVIGWLESPKHVIDLVVSDPLSALYILGETLPEVGGSELIEHLAQIHHEPRLRGKTPPFISPSVTRAVCDALSSAIRKDLVHAAHALHLGGLGAGAAMLCLGSNLGLEIDLDAVPSFERLSPTEVLFSESGARFLVAVAPDQMELFEKHMRKSTIPWSRIGHFKDAPELRVLKKNKPILQRTVEALRIRYKETLNVF